jgi:heme-degrading monooxygenase HmoA
MIVRMWRGQTTAANADTYQKHVTGVVFPSLTGIPGHAGAQVLRRETRGGAEFVVLTCWESMEAIREFAGPEPENRSGCAGSPGTAYRV